MRTRILIVVVALVLGGIAAVLAAQYLRGARGQVASMSEPVEVLVAQQDLPRGLTSEELLKRGFIKSEKVPRQFVAADAVSSERVIANQVLAVPVSAGEILTKTRFQYPAEAGLAYSVPDDLVAISIEVDAVMGVAGLLKPGDNVVVYATFKPDGSDKTAYTQTLVAKARVLAVGAATTAEQTTQDEAAKTGSKSQGSGALVANRQQTVGEPAYKTVTLGVSVEDAERVAFGREIGAVQLALLPQNAEEPAKPAPVWFNGPIYRPFGQIVK